MTLKVKTTHKNKPQVAMTKSKHTIAIDMMSGDLGVSVTAEAVSQIIKHDNSIDFILVGCKKSIQSALKHHGCDVDESKIVETDGIVSMDEDPLKALKSRRSTSMWKAIDLVNQKQADACVSAGNTGALMAISRYLLKMIDGVNRPAIGTSFPSETGDEVLMLDLGANVDCKPEHLVQFAIMGVLSHKKENPTVGLLANGSEDTKGNELVKQVDKKLKQTDHINYIGYVEGNQIFKGHVDVVVCDGFVGNAVLKSCEGTVYLLIKELTKDLKKNWLGLFLAPLVKKALRKFEPKRRSGAVLLGLRGIVVKTHGKSCPQEFSTAIKHAIEKIKNNVSKKMFNSFKCYAK